MDRIDYNLLVGLHNLNMVSNAEKLLNEFLGDDDSGNFIYAYNPDGSCLKLQRGVKFVACTFD